MTTAANPADRAAAIAEMRATIAASREQVATFEATAGLNDMVVCACDAAVMVIQERTAATYGFAATNSPKPFDRVTAARITAQWNRRQPGHPVRQMTAAQWCLARRCELADSDAALAAL